MERKLTREVNIGGLMMGGTNPVIIQSMCNTDTRNVDATVAQILALEEAGCELVRVAIPDMIAADAVGEIKKRIHIPLVADIHFDYRLALRVMELGIDKVRINPGNIGDDSRVKAVADECRRRNIPIRIGVNSGSLEKDILAKYGHPTPEAMRDSALYHASLLEKYDFDNIVLSIKSSDVPTMIRAYQLTAQACDYPLHLGVTEAGTERMGLIKSAVGIGSLLTAGIGDTIRVSLTAAPEREIAAGLDLLAAAGLRNDRPRLVSCPTCGRTAIDLIGIAAQVEERLQTIQKPITVAVMGCIVNGPGEAREADIGLAGGKGKVALFRKGEVLRTVDETVAVEELMKEIEQL